jgi:hypothetical protein
LQIAARHVFEHKIMKDRALQVAGRSVPEAADDIWMANAIERDGLVLEIFDQRAFKIGIEVVLKKNV